jgi:hypothetical protein
MEPAVPIVQPIAAYGVQRHAETPIIDVPKEV